MRPPRPDASVVTAGPSGAAAGRISAGVGAAGVGAGGFGALGLRVCFDDAGGGVAPGLGVDVRRRGVRLGRSLMAE